MMLFPLENDTFYCQHLTDSKENLSLIKKFSVAQPTGKGLELYLKKAAELEEKQSSARTYLVKAKNTDELVAYFTLKAGLFTIDISDDCFYTIPSAELANFAVNATFRKKHPETNEIGVTIFSKFILPLVDFLRSFMGIQALYIYALPERRLMEYYKKIGFKRLSTEQEKFVHQHVKPKYDDKCIFMYQMLA